jgi:hypothetical protein
MLVRAVSSCARRRACRKATQRRLAKLKQFDVAVPLLLVLQLERVPATVTEMAKRSPKHPKERFHRPLRQFRPSNRAIGRT